MRTVKRCPGCNRHLRVVLGTSFNRKEDSEDGLQPWCRECDWNGKATLDEAWNRFRRVLAAEPQSALLWTRETYLALLGDDPKCHWCGTRCREWSIGHWIDRISSTYGHIPSNSIVCCTPCNFQKGHKSTEQHRMFLAGLIKRCDEFPTGLGVHPWGKIPWDHYPSASRFFQRKSAPDLSAFVIPDPQLHLPLAAGGNGR